MQKYADDLASNQPEPDLAELLGQYGDARADSSSQGRMRYLQRVQRNFGLATALFPVPCTPAEQSTAALHCCGSVRFCSIHTPVRSITRQRDGSCQLEEIVC